MTNSFTDLPIEEQFNLEALFRKCGITPEQKKMLEPFSTAEPIVVDNWDAFTGNELYSIGVQFSSKFYALGELCSTSEDKEFFGCLQRLSLNGKGPGLSLAMSIFKSISVICKENGVVFKSGPSMTSQERQEMLENMTAKDRANFELLYAELVLPE
tara:strand:- start:1330 stop:1797 length:468 start_codon:yes stop_codon:yes gene_type:complete